MTLYKEIEWREKAGGIITGIVPGSTASALDIRKGDEMLAINGHHVNDIIDVQFYGAEESLELLLRRETRLVTVRAERQYNQLLGLEFAHPTFDTDIRRCNNLCEFCFVLQMGPRFRRTLYIKDDDYRYSFLFGHYVTLTNLDQHDWWRIKTMGLSPLYISVHVTDTEQRRRFLRNNGAPEIMDQLRTLADWHITMHTQLVIVPGVNDGLWMEQSIRELSGLWPAVQSISVVPVGLTRQHKYGLRKHTADEAETILESVNQLQREYKKKFGARFVYATDEWYLMLGREVPTAKEYDGLQLQENGLGMVRDFLDHWQRERREIGRTRDRSDIVIEKPATHPGKVILATGELFAPTLLKIAGEFSDLTGIQTEVVAIENNRLGSSITVAGLLMGEDLLDQLASHRSCDLIVLPRVMFDHPGVISLDNMTPQQVAAGLGMPVALADTMGDIWDATRGHSRVVYHP